MWNWKWSSAIHNFDPQRTLKECWCHDHPVAPLWPASLCNQQHGFGLFLKGKNPFTGAESHSDLLWPPGHGKSHHHIKNSNKGEQKQQLIVNHKIWTSINFINQNEPQESHNKSDSNPAQDSWIHSSGSLGFCWVPSFHLIQVYCWVVVLSSSPACILATAMVAWDGDHNTRYGHPVKLGMSQKKCNDCEQSITIISIPANGGMTILSLVI